MNEYVERHGLLSRLGIEIVESEPGRAVMALPFDPEFTNPNSGDPGVLHGGLAATLIDTSSAFAFRTLFDDPVHTGMTTTDLTVSYVRPATNDMRAEATVVRAGGSIGVTDVEVTSVAPDGERKIVALGNTTYRLFRPDGE